MVHKHKWSSPMLMPSGSTRQICNCGAVRDLKAELRKVNITEANPLGELVNVTFWALVDDVPVEKGRWFI